MIINIYVYEYMNMSIYIYVYLQIICTYIGTNIIMYILFGKYQATKHDNTLNLSSIESNDQNE